jgi:hypothetical protein
VAPKIDDSIVSAVGAMGGSKSWTGDGQGAASTGVQIRTVGMTDQRHAPPETTRWEVNEMTATTFFEMASGTSGDGSTHGGHYSGSEPQGHRTRLLLLRKER